MVRDLGTLEGPVLLFGGPYSNLQALQALLDTARGLGVPKESMICTGDVVAYCGDPAGTVDLLMEAGVAVVAGNCEKQLAKDAPDCGCGFDAGSTCDLLSAGWYGFAGQRLVAKHRAWMAACPDVIRFRHHGGRYAVIHGGVSNIARFLWPVSEETVFREEWALVEALCGPVQHVIAGHCGLPFLRDTTKGRWINAGVIGMPPNDGSPDTRFAVLDKGEVDFRPLRYDVAAAVSDMVRAGLTQGYDLALDSGYWPSEEILPGSLRRGFSDSG